MKATVDTAMFSKAIEIGSDLTLPEARALLKIHFSTDGVQRMAELSAKARAGTLSPAEQIEISVYEQMGCLLDILHSKARRALKKRRSAS